MLIVDYFAGGGGASTGIAQALGRAPDVAVDHWATALDTHAANHPTTLHMRDDVWRVRPRRDIPGGPVGIMWASPSCTHHSRAKSKAGPLSEQLRAQPWVVTRFASQRRPYGRLAGIVQTGYGERPTQTPRALDIRAPLGTVVAGGAKHALFTAWIVKHFGGVVGHGVDRPLGTITVRDHHGLVAAHLEQYNGTGTGQDVRAPLGTVTTRDRFALVQTFIRRHLGECVAPVVTVRGERYAIVDIGMRMLAPRELARAMGFADSYELLGTKTDQIAQLGNAVVPQVARALVAANAPSGMRVAS